jgi:hypothetical protein
MTPLSISSSYQPTNQPTPTMATTHESDIPSIAAHAAHSRVEERYIPLSFAVATSLAIAKRLTWEQTPWLAPKLSSHQCTHIASYISRTAGKSITPEAIRNCLLFGKTYILDRPLDGNHLQIRVVFPKLKHDAARHEGFLRSWHDEMVKPAFDTTWEESGLVQVRGGYRDMISRITGRFHEITHHKKQARSFAGLLNHLRNEATHQVSMQWPEWADFRGPGYEGSYSGKRAHVFDEAWTSIKGMLKNYPGLQDFQDAFLLVVSTERIDFAPTLGSSQLYKVAGEQWDKCVDSRFVCNGSFKVVTSMVLGDADVFEDQADKEVSYRIERDSLGIKFHRITEDDGVDAQQLTQHPYIGLQSSG